MNYLETRNYEWALERFNKAIELDSKDPKFYNSKALTLYYYGQYDHALNEFQKALNLFQPAQASECWYNKGNTLLNLNRLEEALESF